MKQDTLAKLFFSAKGRINRQKFLFANIGWGVAIVAVMIMSTMFTAMAFDPEASAFPSIMADLFGIISIILYILVIYSSIVLQIKRWHDLDKSGWFTLLGFVPLVGIVCFIYILFVVGTKGDNQFGKDPLA